MLIQELKDFAESKGFQEVICKCGNPTTRAKCYECDGFGAYYLKDNVRYSYLWIEARKVSEEGVHYDD